MGGKAPDLSQTYNNAFGAYLNTLPQALNVTTQGQTAADLAAAKSAAATTPLYSQAALTNLQQYGMPMEQAGADINRAAMMSSGQTGVDMLSQLGPQYAQAYRQSDMMAKPEAYQAMQKAMDYANSINLNSGLSGSERAEIERSLGASNYATGNMGLDNATNAVSNAMQFGQAGYNRLQQQRTALGNALQNANQSIGMATGNFNPSGALSTATPSNFGTQNFTGVAPTGTQAFQFGSNLMNNTSQLANTNQQLQWQANQANSSMSKLGMAGSLMQSLGSLIGAGSGR